MDKKELPKKESIEKENTSPYLEIYDKNQPSKE